MASIHFVCLGRLNLNVIRHPIWESGDWDLTIEEAQLLVGGMLYLHERKAEPAYFGGRIIGFRRIQTDRAHSDRVVFNLESLREAKGFAWRGKDHGRAWTSGVVEER